MKHIAIIGGGVTGVTTAYALARRGFQVTLLERHRYPAMETSFANGGQLSACHAEVWNRWATIFKGLKWMMKRDAPLLIHPRPSWHKLSWFGEFVAAIPRYRDNTIATARLAVTAREHLFRWADDEGIEFDLRRQGILHVYRKRADFDHAAGVSRLLAQGGLLREAVTPEQMRIIEPTLQGSFYGGYYTDSDSSGDIHKFTSGLAAAAQRLGVTIRCDSDVTAVTADAGGARITLAGGDVVRADAVAICAGVASRKLAASLGDHVNVYPVKGYSITVQLDDAASRAAAPTVSLLDDEVKLVASRFGEDRLRVAGTAEFNGINRDIRADRVQPLIDWVHRHFPDIATRQVSSWAGLRPMMPDLVPRVGPGRIPCVFYNTGHGHLGWTLSAATAELVADYIEKSWMGTGLPNR